MQEKCINSHLLFLENVIEYNTELNFYALDYEEEIIKCIIGGNMCGIYGSVRK